MRKVWALARASWLDAVSYRLRMALTFFGLLATLVPIYYVARAVQPLVGDAIAGEGADYFAFLVVGLTVFPFIRIAVTALPGELGSAISTGTLEALLGTPTRISTLLAGMMGYPAVWAALRASSVLAFGWVMGVQLVWSGVPLAIVALALIVLAHVSVGVLGAALVLAFRTAGPLEALALWLSSTLAGLYVPTQVIPAWLEGVSAALPLTYGLRVFRRALLDPGTSWAAVVPDLIVLAAMGTTLCAAALGGFGLALRYSRRAGTLAQY